MWLLNVQTYILEAFEGSSIPPYAILLHRWEEDEVCFADMIERRHESRKGWAKIKSCCNQACNDRLQYVWVDTCCIDKKSSAELSEAINSMFRWYQQAKICYAYLSDVFGSMALTQSVWFTRGWTLQELLAPKVLFFFDKYWGCIGSKHNNVQNLSERTGIPERFLHEFNLTEGLFDRSNQPPSIAQRMSWAAGRHTTRVEDRAYSLMGLFDVNMPLLYGEGPKAFYRLQNEIMKSSRDLSIFAWRGLPDPPWLIIAASPDDFARCKDFRAVYNRYDFAKHGLNVYANLASLGGNYHAMAVARLLEPNVEDCLVCIPLKRRPTTPFKSPNETYSRYICKGEGLVFLQYRTSFTSKTIEIDDSLYNSWS